MSEIKVEIKNNEFIISRTGKRTTQKDTEKIDINSLEFNKKYKSYVNPINKNQNYKIIMQQNIANDKINFNTNIEDNDNTQIADNKILMVYIENNIIYYHINTENIYNKLIKIPKKIFKIGLNKKYCYFFFIAFIINPYKLKIESTKFCLDGANQKDIYLREYTNKNSILKKIFLNLHFVKFNMKDVLVKESPVNNVVAIKLTIDNGETIFSFSKKNKFIKNTKMYYAPFKSAYTKDHAIHLRRSLKGTLVFVRRRKEEIEYNLKFIILENKYIQYSISLLARIYKLFNNKNVNLYFEKFAEKAEEGTFELFKLSLENNTSKNYFIIDEHSNDYKLINKTKNVIKKYSLKYYFIYYCADNFIATEAPSHVNLLRSNNSVFRKKSYKTKNIFLQHGITYLKYHGKTSAYIKGKEADCNYIVASSQKEVEVICQDFNMTEDAILITGLSLFSKLKHKHIDNNFKNTVTIMLTWKPYEEHLEDFSTSSYYKNVVSIYNIVLNYIDKENIYIVAHPKVYDLLNKTDLKNSMWQKSISEVLSETKLMITDYSSVCYNSFYQGSGVIFTQPDLELYEKYNGKLIPNDNEYIGNRILDLKDLDNLLKNNIKNKIINLDKLRTKEHEKNYKTINEFNDGKNTERIYKRLLELEII